MAEPPLAVSPLGGVSEPMIASPGLVLTERPFLGKIKLRGNPVDGEFADRAALALGHALPGRSGAGSAHGATSVLCLAPGDWLVISEANAADLMIPLREALRGQFAAIVNVSGATATVGAAGWTVPGLLRKICSLDIARQSDRCCWATRLGPFTVLIHRRNAADTYDFHVARSFARSFWIWLGDAAAEFGASRDDPTRPA